MPVCSANLSLPGQMIQKDLFPFPGGMGWVAGSVGICRVFSVCLQHPSAIRRCSGLAEVSAVLRHPRAEPRHWARDTQSICMAPAQVCQWDASTLVSARPAGAGLGMEQRVAIPAPSLSA